MQLSNGRHRRFFAFGLLPHRIAQQVLFSSSMDVRNVCSIVNTFLFGFQACQIILYFKFAERDRQTKKAMIRQVSQVHVLNFMNLIYKG